MSEKNVTLLDKSKRKNNNNKKQFMIFVLFENVIKHVQI